MKITFPEGNVVVYGQDFGQFCGVPAGIEFEAEWFGSDGLRLTAPGYGVTGHGDQYGNGSLYVSFRACDVETRKIVKSPPVNPAIQAEIDRLAGELHRLRELVE